MRRLGLALAGLALAGCASTSAFHRGETAEHAREYDRAVLEYAKAARLEPDNIHYKKALERARRRASDSHAQNGRQFASQGRYKEALDEFRLALDLTPDSPTLAAEMGQVEARRQAGRPALSIDEMKQRARETGLPGLAIGPVAREPLGLSFRSASVREVYQALGKAAGINFIFDPQLQDVPITLDLSDVAVEQALNALAGVARTFHRVVDPRVVMVVPDTPTKRREYEQQVVKTFFLSNADVKDTIDLLRIVLGARRVGPVPGANALTINDTPDKVAAAERIVQMVDKQRSEVVVDVEILEVNRTRLKDYGIEITSGIPGVPGIAGAIFPSTTVEEVIRDPQGNPVFVNERPITLDDNPYAKENLVLTALPGVIYRLLQSDSDTRLLANPQLRTTEGNTAQARFGDQVPVPVTVFTPIAQGGVAQQPVTSFEYKNVGVNIDLTPRVHHDGEVSLGLKLEISSLGPLFQNNPTFRSRIVNSAIRLKDGETNMLAGLISDEERLSLTGLPGLASIPVLGQIFSRTRREVTETDIVMTLTPHVVRRTELTEEDLRSFTMGAEGVPPLFEVPAVPPIVAAPPAPAPEPSPELARPEPIRPPPAPAASPTPYPQP
jgi:general secretion pathway protein D